MIQAIPNIYVGRRIMEQKILRELQLTELEILKPVDALCMKEGIQYYLVGGTLLGAIRHKGFIPWDDDLDIAIPRADYNRFIEICLCGGLGKNYELHHISTDKNYWLPFAKIRKKNTLFNETDIKMLDCRKGIFIDVFPLDSCAKNSGLTYHLRAKIVKTLNFVINMRVRKCKIKTIQAKVIYLITRPFSIKTITLFRDTLCTKQKSGKYIINYASNYKYTKQTMDKSIYGKGIKVSFENGKFCAPILYIKYLEQLFENWKQLPPEEERRNHNPTNIIFDLKKEGR